MGSNNTICKKDTLEGKVNYVEYDDDEDIVYVNNNISKDSLTSDNMYFLNDSYTFSRIIRNYKLMTMTKKGRLEYTLSTISEEYIKTIEDLYNYTVKVTIEDENLEEKSINQLKDLLKDLEYHYEEESRVYRDLIKEIIYKPNNKRRNIVVLYEYIYLCYKYSIQEEYGLLALIEPTLNRIDPEIRKYSSVMKI